MGMAPGMNVKPYRISTGQTILLLSMANIGAAQLYIPSLSYEALGRSGWLLPLAAIGVATLGGKVFARLGSQYHGRSYFDYALVIGGKPFGRLAALLLAIAMLAFVPVVTKVFTALVSAELLPKTPPVIISMIILLISAFAAQHGIEALTRLTQIFSLAALPLIMLLMLAPLLLPLEPGYLIPVSLVENMRVSASAAAAASASVASAAAAAAASGSMLSQSWIALAAGLMSFPGFTLMTVLTPFLDKPHHAGKVAFWGTLLPAVLVILSVAYPVMIFGWPAAATYARPFWEVLSVVQLAPAIPIQRLAYFLTITTRFISYITLSVYWFAGAAGLKAVLMPKATPYRRIILSTAPIILATVIFQRYSGGFPEGAALVHIALAVSGLLIPALLLEIALFKRRVQDRKRGRRS